MKVLTITLGVFVPIYLQTHAALRGIDLRYVELAADRGPVAGPAFIRRVVLPGALPGFFWAFGSRSPAPGCPWWWWSKSTPPAASAT